MGNETRKKILICIDWFEPAYKAGGPIRSIKNMVELLKNTFDFYILTSDRDTGDDKPFENTPLGKWIRKEGYLIYYLSKEKQDLSTISAILGSENFHSYYFNSLFSIKFTLLPLLALKTKKLDPKAILAPRGMLGKGALEIKSGKKKFFLKLSRLLGLFKNISWHASTELEKEEIIAQFGNAAKVNIAQNVSQKQQTIAPLRKENKVKFIFLGRISPKKNLLGAISFFENLQFDQHEVLFHIYGPIEDKEYWKTCSKKMDGLKGNVEITYMGSLNRNEVFHTLSDYHFMLFPSKNENFGHTIAEAFLSGLPVIISDQTPWKNLMGEKAGWDLSLHEPKSFVETIQSAVRMNDSQYQEWRKSAREYAEKKLFSKEIIEANKKLFE